MPTRTDNAEGPTPLRRRAEDRLRGGTSPAAKLATTGVEALTLLHRMASDPGSASAALKLLHELQVHQVELDLQLEQLEQMRNDLTRDVDRYAERFDLAPVALLAVERNGGITEANLVASNLLGIDRDALRGRGIDIVVRPQSRSTILALLKRLCDGSRSERCTVDLHGGASMSRPVQVDATVTASNGSLLLALIETTDRGTSDRNT